MTKIKTRDVIKGTVKTIDKAATASERMKSTYAKTKEKAEQSYYADENSATEYATDKVTHSVENMTRKGIRTFDKQGRKSVKKTGENIGKAKDNLVKAKDKVADFKQKRANQSAEKQTIREISNKANSKVQTRSKVQKGAIKNKATSNVSSQAIRAKRQSVKTIKTSARSAGQSVKTTAKGTIKATEKGIKTAHATSKATIKTADTTVKATKVAVKTSVEVGKRTVQAAKVTAKATIATLKGAAKVTIATIKALIMTAKALIAAIIAGGWIAVLIILIVVLFGGALAILGGGNSNSNSYTPVSAEVQAYEPLIRHYAKEHGIPEYVELIKAVMMQESGGRGNDPMQASECGFNTRYPRSPNAITDPEYSIDVGIQNLAECLRLAEAKTPIDMDNIKLALQGYNYGNNYISWARTNYGGYTITNAIEFSDMMAERTGWDRYGDKQYVPHVLRYYPFGRSLSNGGNNNIVEIARSQIGNVGGQPYWSWYGFSGRVEWCATFVSWCADQAGYIETGIIPKFALCQSGANWFKEQGQWQDRSYVPSVGDIIFFDWNGDGHSEHVGIVEKAENGMVYTIEGNSSDMCRQRSYVLGSSLIYGYGVPNY